ncbi:MAG: hypothetical protein ACUVR8_05260 [Acidobacteriota bacterium]
MAQLPIYPDSYRPSSGWVKQLEAVQQAQTTKAVWEAREQWLPKWVSGLETYATLSPDAASTPPKPMALERAARWLLARATAQPKAAQPDALRMADLEAVYRELVGVATSPQTSPQLGQEPAADIQVWRTEAGRPQVETHQPAAPAALPVLLEMTLDWFATDAFAELHPVEQAGLFHLRLLDLQPFAAENNTLVRLLSSFYVLRAGFPPIIPVADEYAAYRDAVGYAFQMITQPGVELFARWLLAAYALIGTQQEEKQ